MTTRLTHFRWCPHGTRNVQDCLICRDYRHVLASERRDGALEALRRLRELILAVDESTHPHHAADICDAEIARVEREGDTPK